MALVGTKSTVVVHGLLSPAGIHGHRPFPMGAQVHGKNPRFTSPRSTVHGHGLLGPEFCRRHSTCFSIEHYLFSCSSTCWFHRQLLLISWCAQILPGCAPEVRHKAVRISCRPDRSMMIAAVSVLPIIRVLSAIGIHGFLIRSAKLLIFVGQMSECTVMHSLGSHFTGLHSISPCRTFQITSKLGT